MSENKISVPRAQVFAPPGFSGPSWAPPPGFFSHERMEQTFDNISVGGRVPNGLDMRSNFPSHLNNLSSYQQQNSFQQPMSSLMSNGHWNGGNDIGMADLLRNERMGFNRYYSGHEETKFQLPTSAFRI